VEEDNEALQQLMDDMVETMHVASGIGLAAPQVGRKERLFVIDLSPMSRADEEPDDGLAAVWNEPVVMVNPEIIAVSEEMEDYEEGCLSIPDITEIVERPTAIQLRYFDRKLKEQDLEVSGMSARVIQHEFDHLNGVLFVDRLTPLRRRLLKRRLRDMTRGEVDADYPLVLPPTAKKRS
jgi:peptide deformylase